MKYLLIEDDCAPDAREYFEKILLLSYRLTLEDFKEKGKDLTKDDIVRYEYKGYFIEMFPEEQYWHFGRIKQTRI